MAQLRKGLAEMRPIDDVFEGKVPSEHVWKVEKQPPAVDENEVIVHTRGKETLFTEGSSSAADAAAPSADEPAEEPYEPPDDATLEAAAEAKARGNKHFKTGEWDAAIELYTAAIELLPSRAPESAAPYANRAACHAKLGEHKSVVEDCTSALRLQPSYVKALMRRALAHEALDAPSEASEDAKRACELEPSRENVALAKRLEGAAAAKLERQKEEMMGQLKSLGNSVLGAFGMSLDNFKAEQDPNTGSYNISFQQSQPK